MKHQIVSRWDSAKVLFECDVPDSMAVYFAILGGQRQGVAA